MKITKADAIFISRLLDNFNHEQKDRITALIISYQVAVQAKRDILEEMNENSHNRKMLSELGCAKKALMKQMKGTLAKINKIKNDMCGKTHRGLQGKLLKFIEEGK